MLGIIKDKLFRLKKVALSAIPRMRVYSYTKYI